MFPLLKYSTMLGLSVIYEIFGSCALCMWDGHVEGKRIEGAVQHVNIGDTGVS